MTSPRFAETAARLLARAHERAAASVPPPSPDARAGAIAAVEAALREKRARRRRMRIGAGIAAAAAVVAIVGAVTTLARHVDAPVASAPTTAPSAPPPVSASLGVAHPAAAGATVLGAGPAVPLVEGQTLRSGDRVVVKPGGHALLAFAGGTQLAAEAGADVTIVEQGAAHVFALAAGAVRADVAKLGPGERFVVRTGDAEVEVRGTSFRVATSDAACEGTTTRVAVYEGTVVVRHGDAEERVSAGHAWPAACEAVAVAAPPPTSAPDAPRSHRASKGAAREAIAPAGPAANASAAPPSSTLQAQNDLFAEAMAAKRRGDARAAIAAFDRFLARYPASPLAESAAASRMKLLRDVDPAAAADAARSYLARYPNGFARTEARSIAEAR